MVVARLIQNRSLPVELVVMPTLRESDGLAMSSRNMRLDPDQRRQAPAIYQCLTGLRKKLVPGSLVSLKQDAVDELTRQGFKVDYVEVADAETLDLVDAWDGHRSVVALVAAFLGEVRLIDNLTLHP
jgi:pantoate--beta-alanine ligase